jgi:hypothetical protein
MKEINTSRCIYQIEIEQLWLGMNNMKVTSKLHRKHNCDITFA